MLTRRDSYRKLVKEIMQGAGEYIKNPETNTEQTDFKRLVLIGGVGRGARGPLEHSPVSSRGIASEWEIAGRSAR